MRTDSSLHCRSYSQGLVNPCKVVVHMKQSDHRNVVVQLLAECVSQASEASHVHPHVEILPLHKARRDVRLIRVAYDFHALGSQTLRGAVAFLAFRIVAEHLHQLRVVDLISKRVRNGKQVHLMAVRGQLDSIRQSASYILKEVRCTPRIPPAYGPANNKLRIRVNRGEGPDVSAIAYAIPHLGRRVLLLGITKAPNLIDLDTFRRYIANSHIKVLLASLADAGKQPKDSALRYASQSHGGANRATLDQRRDYRDLLFRANYVRHESTLRQRFRIVNSTIARTQRLLSFLDLRPPRFSGLARAPFTLFVCHSFKPALAADLPAFGPHVTHDLLDDGKLSRLCGFQENSSSVLNGVKFWSIACPLWHTPKRCMDYEIGQEGSVSNRPTTDPSSRFPAAENTRGA